MANDGPKFRLFVKGDLNEGAELDFESGHVHYLAQVLRLKSGDGILIFNGLDGEWQASLETLTRKRATARIQHRTREQTAEDGPWLAFAPVKKARTDFIVEKATELGASRLLPVITRFTESRRVNEDRLAAIATEAAEQCGRLSLPEVHSPRQLEAFLSECGSDHTVLFADEHGGGLALVEILQPLSGSGRTPVFLVGPEGGFAPDERQLLLSVEAVTAVDLGPRTLRAETAAIAALSCWQALTRR